MKKDDILSKALEEVFNETCEELTGLEVSDHEFSDEFEEKMEKLIEKLSEPEEKKRKGIVWKIVTAVAAAAAMLCLWTGIRNTTGLIQKEIQPKNIITDENVPATEQTKAPVTTSITEGTTVYTTAAEAHTKVTTAVIADNTERTVMTAVVTENSQVIVSTQAVPVSGNTTVTAPVSNTGRKDVTTAFSGTVKAPAIIKTTASAEPPTITTIQTTLNDDIVITTTVTSTTTEDERSIIMKKAALFLSGLIASSSISIPTANAEYKIDRGRYFNQQLALTRKIESGEINPDVNMDGKFDLDDCRALQYESSILKGFKHFSGKLVVTPETEKNILDNFDFDEDGKISYWESVTLLSYFMENNDLKEEYFEPTYYDPDYVKGTITYESEFVSELKNEAKRIYGAYSLFEKMVNDGEIDLDFYEDGKIDIYDFFMINAFAMLPSYNEIHDYEKHEIILDTTEYYFYHPEELGFSESQIEKFDNLIRTKYVGDPENAFHLKGALLVYCKCYFVLNCDIMPEYFEDSFYADLLPEADVSRFYTGQSLKGAMVYLGLADDEYDDMKFDEEIFEEAFYNYYTNAENGTAALPDLNMDGSLDMTDYELAMDFIVDKWNRRTAEESSIPADIWNHINEDCDFSGNGTSGDIYDSFIAQMYILMKVPEDLPAQDETSDAVTFEQGFAMLSNMDIKRSGDASCDGQLKMNDAVTILCHYTNPDDFQLSPKAEFNADICNTGDGVTPMDALKIQRILIGAEEN